MPTIYSMLRHAIARPGRMLSSSARTSRAVEALLRELENSMLLKPLTMLIPVAAGVVVGLGCNAQPSPSTAAVPKTAAWRNQEAADLPAQLRDADVLEQARLPVRGSHDASDFSHAFSNGMTVELVGICDYPTRGKVWWKPDGSPLSVPPEEHDEKSPPEPGDREGNAGPRRLVFALRTQRVLAPFSKYAFGDVQLSGSCQMRPSTRGESAQSWRLVSVVPATQRRTVVPFRFTLGDEEVLWVGDRTGRQVGPHPAHRLVTDESQFKMELVDVVEHDNGIRVTKRLRNNLPGSRWNFVAIDTAGRKHLPLGGVRHAGWAFEETDQVFFPVKLEALERLEYRRLPSYDYGVTFTDVSLEPGLETTVGLDIVAPDRGDVEVLVNECAASLRSIGLPFLDEGRLQLLADEVREDLAAIITEPLTFERRELLADGIRRRVMKSLRHESLYLEFRGRFDAFKWDLKRAVSRPALDEQETARRDAQRTWMRDHIANLPADNDSHATTRM
ncbi:MAG: hypothetical protein ABI614_22325, partial [Planctomycetota bacterium]